MSRELLLFAAVQGMLLYLVIEIWRGSQYTQAEFFPPRRAAALRGIRWRVAILFIVTLSGLSSQYLLSNQRLQQLNDEEVRAARYEQELFRLRLQYAQAVHDMERRRVSPATAVVDPPPAPAVQRYRLSSSAKLRAQPGGAVVSLLPANTEVQRQQDAELEAEGRRWSRVAHHEDQVGWVASELLVPLP